MNFDDPSPFWHENVVTAILLVGISTTVYLSYKCIDRNNDTERYWMQHHAPVAHVIRACRYILYMVLIFGVQLILLRIVQMVVPRTP